MFPAVAALKIKFAIGMDKMKFYKRNYRIKTKEQAAAERALRHREKQFAAEHEADTDAQLLAYLKQEAENHPGQMLRKTEVPGGELIGKRFGGWKAALEAAGLIGETYDRDESNGAGGETAAAYTENGQR